MASTFVNDLRLEEIGDGEQSTTWGQTTNTNLELIAEAFSFGTEAITTNANTHTTTIADGSTDPGRSIFLKYTGTLDSECTITIGPNTVSKLWFIENATSGSQNIAISQGSGANVTIANGQTKVVYSDGAGSGAAIVDALQDLSIPDLFIDDDLTVTDDLTVGDDVLLNSDGAIIKLGADADVTLTHVADTGVTLASGTNATTLQVDSTADNVNAAPKLILNRARSGNTQDGDIGGQIEFKIKNDASGTPEQIDFAKIFTTAVDFTDATEDGKLTLQTITAGAAVNSMEITGTATTLNTITDDANAGPILNLKRTRGSGTAADNDLGGQIDFLMNDAGGNETTISRVKSKLTTAADGNEHGLLSLGAVLDGTITDIMEISGQGSAICVVPAIDSDITTGIEFGVNGTTESTSKNEILGPDVNRMWKAVNTQRVRIGNVANTEGSAAHLEMMISGNGIIINNALSGMNAIVFRTSGNGTDAGAITCSGSSTNYGDTSDYRVKENIVNLTGAINRVKALQTYRFNFINDTSKTVDGFLAHEVASVVPEAVTGEKDAVDGNGNIQAQSVDRSKLVPVLTAALQEAIAKIEALETRVAALEG
tara:strand:+ start:410 stop:2203 length:1794 start_codon:yes stop_codon:yes gene_type:complete